jgi:hypothetical protein
MPDKPIEGPVETPDEAAAESRKEARGELPAVFVDTWGFVSWRGHLRITVGEEIGDTDIYRFAFLMELTDAEKFAKHILRVVEKRRSKDGALGLGDVLPPPPEEN